MVQRSLSKETTKTVLSVGIYTTSNLGEGPLEKRGEEGEIFELYFLGQCKNISGLLYVHGFFSFIFPLYEFSFLYFARPPITFLMFLPSL